MAVQHFVPVKGFKSCTQFREELLPAALCNQLHYAVRKGSSIKSHTLLFNSRVVCIKLWKPSAWFVCSAAQCSALIDQYTIFCAIGLSCWRVWWLLFFYYTLVVKLNLVFSLREKATSAIGPYKLVLHEGLLQSKRHNAVHFQLRNIGKLEFCRSTSRLATSP